MKNFFASAVLLAGGIAMCGYFIGKGITDRNKGGGSISVKGSAERHVPATVAIWDIGYRSSGNDPVELVEKLKKDTEFVIGFLTTKHGFTKEEISVQPPSISDTSLIERDADTPPPALRYNGYQSILLRTSKVDAVKPAESQMSDLIRDGVMLSGSNSPRYMFDALNDIKPAMIQEATKNARLAADQFAKDSETKLGKLQNASQGWFQIDDRDSATPEIKIVRVVVEVMYEVE